MPPLRSNAERSRRTRRALPDVGRALFTDSGYTHTSTGAIVRRVGVTRGAVYHHFPSKTALFATVFAEICRECLHAVQTRMETAEGETWGRFMASLGVLPDQLGRPSVQRIVYVDGPIVLGWSRAHRQSPGTQFLHAVFAQLCAEGVIRPLPLDLSTHLVRALCSQGARMTTTTRSARFQHRKTALVLKGSPGCQPVASTPRPASFPHTTGRLRPPWGKPRMGGEGCEHL